MKARRPSDLTQAGHEKTLVPGSDVAIVWKTTGMVSGLDLQRARAVFVRRGIRSWIPACLSTSAAALRTAVHADDIGFRDTMIGDTCAHPEPEVHECTLREMLRMEYMKTERTSWYNLGPKRAV
ncbi:hypothetical protein EJ03DRAFT_323038 [Teratosphaeria nubilosa]|uniref:Isochorismatase-like domain-containing protein n=1 Tax=Teratosphaeria nubilosa TaxID=161662 RepID=A0A6G1LND1_9PEZI|nr:hypothetical protein EJ03DRAFT_323038 [Teratosphaeria nubilosa]